MRPCRGRARRASRAYRPPSSCRRVHVTDSPAYGPTLGVVGMAVPEAVAIATAVCALVGEPRLLVDLAFAADEVPRREQGPDHVFAEAD
jgi:hypothetical protein